MRLAPLLFLLLAAPAFAQLQGVGTRFSPSAAYVQFDGDAALTDGLLYGGTVGLSFGEFVELGGTYLRGDVETDFSELSGLEDAPGLAAALAALDPRSVGLQRYGALLTVNLGRKAFTPFLLAGTGLVRFAPEDRDPTRNIYLVGGAGLRLTGASRYAVAVSVEDLAYRYNPGSTFFTGDELADVGLGYEDFNQTTVHNLGVRGSVQLVLGGRRPGALSDLDRELQRQFSGGLSGLRLAVEPFYGRVRFDDAFVYRDQAFAGAEVGLELGPLVGVRAFYGRGVDTGDPTTAEGIQMAGGALRLRLSDGDGLVPFLTVGGGYLDVLDSYATDANAGADDALAQDRPFASGGVGAELPLGSRVRAVAEVRALVMSAQDEADVSRPEEVYASPMLRAGVSVGLGGRAADRVDVVRQSDLERERADYEARLTAERAQAAEREAELDVLIAAAEARGDSLAVARYATERAGLADSTAAMPAAPVAVATRPEPRMVTIPIPEQGELYVRYGDPGGVQIGEGFYESPATGPPGMAALSEAEVREMIRSALSETVAAQGGQVTEADLANVQREVEDRLADRIASRLAPPSDASDARIAALEARQDELIAEIRSLRVDLLTRQAETPLVIQPGATPASPATTAAPVETMPQPVAARPVRNLVASPVTGFSTGRGPETLLLGVRADVPSGSRLRYLPELLLGVGTRTSVMANADVGVALPTSALAEIGTPYVRAGVGLVSYGASDELPPTFDEEPDPGATALALNLGLGADLAVLGGRLFADVSTGNFGRYNRVTAGYRYVFGSR